MANLDTFANGLFLLQVMQAVEILFLLHSLIAFITYGVVPDAAIPIRRSF